MPPLLDALTLLFKTTTLALLACKFPTNAIQPMLTNLLLLPEALTLLLTAIALVFVIDKLPPVTHPTAV
ncbi:MAG: hypothetical protein Q8J97_01360, partial [Flavobacteriaceae bacterium]|nr:hypothetical protein [Flavobacteriaceae bacterium]